MKLDRKVNHVIFDMDGVLLDTEPMYSKATNQIASRYGKEFTWEVKAQTLGRDFLIGAKYIVEGLSLPLTPLQFLKERSEILAEWYPDSNPISGAQEFTAFLSTHGISMGVATSSPLHHFQMKTEKKHSQWFKQFSTIVTGDDPKIKNLKPAPDIFLLAAERMKAKPQDCVVFEDAPAGVEAALAAGMQVVALPDDEMDRNLVQNATLIIDGYRDILEMDIWH